MLVVLVGFDGLRFMVCGLDLWMCLMVVLVIFMVLYEFGINVIKYGVLLNGEGMVDFVWSDVDGFEMCWIEWGGFEVVVLLCCGFGICFI